MAIAKSSLTAQCCGRGQTDSRGNWLRTADSRSRAISHLVRAPTDSSSADWISVTPTDFSEEANISLTRFEEAD
jgi:hypothetical protein